MILMFFLFISLWILFISLSFSQDDLVENEISESSEEDDTRPLDEIFTPSEEISADEEVTFPVNI